jgi:hypothetical protein
MCVRKTDGFQLLGWSGFVYVSGLWDWWMGVVLEFLDIIQIKIA